MRSLTVLQVVLFLALSPHADAQVLFGSIVGNVTDPSSAGVPGAQVKVTNTGTGQQSDVVTTEDGGFAINTLSPGTYTVTATASGFKSANRRDVMVVSNSTVRVTIGLEVGQVSESIEISAQAMLLKTDTMDVRSEIGAADLQNVPVPVTRNFQTLLVTVPGIAPASRRALHLSEPVAITATKCKRHHCTVDRDSHRWRDCVEQLAAACRRLRPCP